MQRAQGFAQQGAGLVWTHGVNSQNLVQGSFPYAQVTVYLTGTTELATLYSDDNVPPTPMGNPFTADEYGYWWFYAPDGRYDVTLFYEDMIAWTMSDILLGVDPGGWSNDQDAGGNWLQNVGGLGLSNPNCPNGARIFLNDFCAIETTADLQVDGNLQVLGNGVFDGKVQTPSIELNNGVCSATIAFDANCNIAVTGQGGNTIATLSQQGDMSIAGCLTLFNASCRRSICLDANCNVGFYDQSGNETAWITPQGDFYGRNVNASGDIAINGVPLSSAFVPLTRQVIAGAGLTGGGPLSSDVTLALASDPSVNSITADTVYTCHIVCPGTLNLDAPAVNIPNILYVNGIVVDGIPLPPPPVASWNSYVPQLWDADFVPITHVGEAVIGRYSIWGSWMVLSFGIQFNPQGYNPFYIHIGMPQVSIQTIGVGLVFTCYFNNAPGLTPTIADWQVTQVGDVIRVATIGSTISTMMQMSLQGILEVVANG